MTDRRTSEGPAATAAARLAAPAPPPRTRRRRPHARHRAWIVVALPRSRAGLGALPLIGAAPDRRAATTRCRELAAAHAPAAPRGARDARLEAAGCSNSRRDRSTDQPRRRSTAPGTTASPRSNSKPAPDARRRGRAAHDMSQQLTARLDRDREARLGTLAAQSRADRRGDRVLLLALAQSARARVARLAVLSPASSRRRSAGRTATARCATRWQPLERRCHERHSEHRRCSPQRFTADIAPAILRAATAPRPATSSVGATRCWRGCARLVVIRRVDGSDPTERGRRRAPSTALAQRTISPARSTALKSLSGAPADAAAPWLAAARAAARRRADAPLSRRRRDWSPPRGASGR